MQYKEFTQTHSEDLIEQISSILETHMIGKTVIVKGKKGKVIEQVGSDGKTESDEIYKVKFEDGTVSDIPARDMEMQGDISNRKEPSENELEDIVNEIAKNSHVNISRDPQLKISLGKGIPAGGKIKKDKSDHSMQGLQDPKKRKLEVSQASYPIL